MHEINEIYRDFIGRILLNGDAAACRGYSAIELIGNTATVPMKSPLVTMTSRKLGYHFAAAEAAWILSGDNKSSPMIPYSKTIHNFSDDGMFFAGAYGPKIIDQIPYIITCFKNDIGTRQAVINIWRDRPYASKDIPCTLTVQFLIRKNKLHVIDSMRSSDAWLGVPYDWFNFSMLGLYVALILRDALKLNLEIGNLYFYAASSHLYIKSFGNDINDAYRLIDSEEEDQERKCPSTETYQHPQELIDDLWKMAKERVI